MTDRLGLLGASVTQHPEFEALLDWLLQPERAHVRLSIASVRTNTVTPALAGALAKHGTRSLTVAGERCAAALLVLVQLAGCSLCAVARLLSRPAQQPAALRPPRPARPACSGERQRPRARDSQ